MRFQTAKIWEPCLAAAIRWWERSVLLPVNAPLKSSNILVDVIVAALGLTYWEKKKKVELTTKHIHAQCISSDWLVCKLFFFFFYEIAQLFQSQISLEAQITSDVILGFIEIMIKLLMCYFLVFLLVDLPLIHFLLTGNTLLKHRNMLNST